MSPTRRRFIGSILAAGLTAATVVAASSAAGAASASGGVLSFGDAPALSGPPESLAAPIVDMAATPSGNGAWLLAADGGVFTSGDAQFFGSTGAIVLNQPIVAIAATPSANGYWLVARDGGVFSFGDARFAGSTGAIGLQQPIVDMAATPSGNGYWLVARDGGVFAFGDAAYLGAARGPFSASTSIAATKTGRGYVIADASGALYPFGDAPVVKGASVGAGRTAVAVALTRTGKGAWTLVSDGAVHTEGDAKYLGGGNDVPRVGVAITSASDGGYRIAWKPSGPPAPANSGSGRRIVYSIPLQHVWLVEADETVSKDWVVSGKTTLPRAGTYTVVSKANGSYSGNLVLPYMTRFTRGPAGGWIGFHGIPLAPGGRPIQTDEQLGTPLSHGCVRMNQQAAIELWNWAPMGTVVVVLT